MVKYASPAMVHVLVPLLVVVPVLLPIFGDVLIVQLKGSPSGSCIVMLSKAVVIGIPVDPFVGLGVVTVGGLLVITKVVNDFCSPSIIVELYKS